MCVDHPVFSRLYIWGQDYFERVVGDVRTLQNERAFGRTLIVGAGSGLDVAALGAQVTEPVLLEPDPLMCAYLRKEYPGVRLVASPAEHMELDDQTFDTVITSFVLCSVFDVAQVLDEIHRVLEPGGQYLFMEHVKHDAPLASMIQTSATPIWKRIAGGCRLDRDIKTALGRSPLALLQYELVKPNYLIPVVTGQASRPL
ncbi:MAG: class I SAM-dependent methyltransferase [Bacilli bacterium]